MLDNSFCHDSRDCRNDIIGAETLRYAFADQVLSNRVPKDFPSCRFGNWKTEMWEAWEEMVDHVLVNFARPPHDTISIVLLSAICEMSHRSINKDVARPSVKVEEFWIRSVGRRVGRNEADVGNTADVLACPELGGMMQQ